MDSSSVPSKRSEGVSSEDFEALLFRLLFGPLHGATSLELKGVSQSLRSSYCNFATVTVSRTMVAQGVRPLPFEDGLDAESFVTSILQITQKELLPEQALLLFVWPPGLLLAKFATLSRGSGN